MQSLFEKLKNLLVAFEKKKDPLFSIPVSVQEEYISSFPEPQTDVERSFFQYKCQTLTSGKFFYVFANIASMPVYFFLKSSLKRTETDVNREKEKGRAIFWSHGASESLLPEDLQNRFSAIEIISNPTEAFLYEKDLQFIKSIQEKYRFSYYFLLKVLIKLSQTRAIISQGEFESLILCNEYSFTSSIVRLFCENEGISCINVQHGENLFYIGNAFFRFDTCYVWSDFYIELFTRLRAEKSQFKIAVPAELTLDVAAFKKEVDYTYYLQGGDRKTLMEIRNALQKLRKSGHIVAVRMHPRYSDRRVVETIFDGFMIEDPRDISINESLGRTRYAMSLYSAVLLQAKNCGVKTVIDDITNIKKYLKLEELEYEMLIKRDALLSEVLMEATLS